LKGFTQNQLFSMNVMQDELEILNLANYNFWINHLKIKIKNIYHELFHTSILNLYLLSKYFMVYFLLLIKLYALYN
jgi:hypothetical protein